MLVLLLVNLAYASQYAMKELNVCSQSAKDFLFALGQNVLIMLCLHENDTRVSNLEVLNQPEMQNDPVTVAFESAKLRIFLYQVKRQKAHLSGD